jgi:hypothetical protein
MARLNAFQVNTKIKEGTAAGLASSSGFRRGRLRGGLPPEA